MKYLKQLIDTKQTVFKSQEFEMIFAINNKHTIKNILQRLKKAGFLYYHGRNIRTLDKNDYNIFEFASKIRKKSYISFETILQKEAIIFQDYSHTITLASDNTLDKKNGQYNYVFHKIKDKILNNPIGIINHKDKYMIASPERAVCDMIYLYKNYFFDNIDNLDIQKLQKIKNIYNKTTILLIDKLIKHVRSKQA